MGKQYDDFVEESNKKLAVIRMKGCKWLFKVDYGSRFQTKAIDGTQSPTESLFNLEIDEERISSIV